MSLYSLTLSRLTSRKLLRITGPDTYAYLQGLICNDLRHLYEEERVPYRRFAKKTPNVLSTFMLNAQGRSICDMLIYRTASTRNECKFSPPGTETEHDELIIECDSDLASGIANTLYGYRVRRKIAIQMENDLYAWSLYPNISCEHVIKQNQPKEEAKYDIEEILQDCKEVVGHDLIAVNDPRLSYLGMRIISRTDIFELVKQTLHSFINVDISKGQHSDYILHRYALGVGEGPRDHPESNCLPLECNADYLNSVSFNKGCYLGQELTARIHHTGVVRKRLMPIILGDINLKDSRVPLINGVELLDPNKDNKKIGTLRNVYKDRGLALIRRDLLPPSMELQLGGTTSLIKTYIPNWWT